MANHRICIRCQSMQYLEGCAEFPGVFSLPVELCLRRRDELLELSLVLAFLLVQHLSHR